MKCNQEATIISNHGYYPWTLILIIDYLSCHHGSNVTVSMTFHSSESSVVVTQNLCGLWQLRTRRARISAFSLLCYAGIG